MLAIAIFCEIWQMDIKTAFLKWIFLKEELYMMQPKGFVDPKGANKMYKLLVNIVISKKILRTCKIMVMHSNERGECVHVPS